MSKKVSFLADVVIKVCQISVELYLMIWRSLLMIWMEAMTQSIS
ncbi:hypothetical protein [Nostoc sp. FACHB-190]|nr:hypothetical protein [Nostoc sp. FACHB-190]